MKKLDIIPLAITGVFWYFIAGILCKSMPLLGNMWFPNLICALVTSLIIGFLFYTPIQSWKGGKWLLIPVLTIASSSFLFGLLLPISWACVTGDINKISLGLAGFFFIYSLTIFIIILYPLSLLTQYFLRYFFSRSQET